MCSERAFKMKGFLYKNAPTYLSRTHHTNAVVGVFQSLFYWWRTFFCEKIPGLWVSFFLGKKREAGRVESLGKVDGLVVDILTLVADKFFLVVYKKGT